MCRVHDSKLLLLMWMLVLQAGARPSWRGQAHCVSSPTPRCKLASANQLLGHHERIAAAAVNGDHFPCVLSSS